jgi:nucleoid-associated protein YgaU
MSDNMGRIFGGCAALAGIWVFVYWWWEPGEPRIRFDEQRISSPAPAEFMAPAGQPAPPPDLRRPPPATRSEPLPIAVIPPSFREYTVRRGDTLTEIARRELGSARYAEAISRANPYVNLDQIREGRIIKIPLDPGNIQGRPVTQDQPAPVTPAPPPVPSRAGEAEMVEYIVKPGDTLTLIARRHYGSIRYAELIFEANRDQMRTMDQLNLGQKLRLPPKPD